MENNSKIVIEDLLNSFDNENFTSFVKLAQGRGGGAPPPPPSGTGTPPPVPTGTTPTPAEVAAAEEKQRKEEKREQEKKENERQQAKREQDRFVKEKLKQGLDIARKQGTLAEELIKKLGERATLIYKMQSTLSDELIADYFDKFLFKFSIPEETTLDLMELALEAYDSGASMVDALDFVLNHYNDQRNITRTKYVIQEATKMQPRIRHVDIFDLLAQSAKGNTTTGINFTLMGPDNVGQVVLLNQLISLAFRRQNVEDFEEAAIELQKKTDALIRQDEILDRTVGIFNILLDAEFKTSLARITKFVTEQFKIAVNSDEYRKLRRIITLLKLGDEFKERAFSDIKQKPITGTETQDQSKRRSFINDRIVTAQSSPSAVESKKIALDILQSINTDLNKISSLLESDEKSNKVIPADKLKVAALKTKISSFIANLRLLVSKVRTKEYVLTNFYSELSSLINSTFAQEIATPLNITAKQTNAKISIENKFVKLSQSQDSIFSSSSIIKNLFSLGLQTKGYTTLLGLFGFQSVYLAAVAVLGTLLWNRAGEREEAIKRVGLGAPVFSGTPDSFISDTANILNLLGKINPRFKSQSNLYLKYEDSIKQNELNLRNAEEKFLNILNGEIIENLGGSIPSASVPFGNPEQVDAAHKSLLQTIRVYQAILRNFKNWINQYVVEARTINLTFPQKSILDSWELSYREKIGRLDQIYRKYVSIKNVIAEMQKVRQLYRKIKESFPQFETYTALGFTVVDIMRMPGGLRSKLNEIGKNLRTMRDKSYNELLNVKARKQQVVDKVKEAPSTSPTKSPSGSSTSTTTAPPSPSRNLPEVLRDIQKAVTPPEMKFNPRPPSRSPRPTTSSENNSEMKYASNLEQFNSEHLLLPDQLAQSYVDTFKFSNVIYEKNIRISGQAQVDYYTKKIDDKKNLVFLQNYIPQDSKLTNLEQSILLDKVRKNIKAKLDHYTNQLKNSNVKIEQIFTFLKNDKNNINSNDYKNLEDLYILAKNPNSKFSIDRKTGKLANMTVDQMASVYLRKIAEPGEYPFEDLNPDIAEQLAKEGLTGLSADPQDTIQMLENEEKAIEQQLIEREAELNEFEGFMTRLLINPPANLSELRTKLTNNDQKFIKLANKNVEADEVNIEYVGDYYDKLYDESKDSPEFGEALKHPEKWRKVPTTEIPEQD